MKRFSLWFAVALVLFSFLPGWADEQALPLDLATLPPGVIKYDNFHPDSNPIGQSLKNDSNYWVAVLFQVPNDSFGFTIRGVEFKVDNELINDTDTAHLYLVSNKFIGPEPQPDWSSILQVVPVVAPFNRLQGKEFPSSIEFGAGAVFWLVLGPVPGGRDDSLRGQGWWAFSDKTPNLRSYASFGDSVSWSKRPSAAGNFVLRSRGDFSPPPEVIINEVMFNADPFSSDSARNHEWVELYNKGGIQTVNRNRWRLANQSTDTNLWVRFPPPPFGDIDFPSGWYVVVHFRSLIAYIDSNSNAKRIDIYAPYNPSQFFDDNRKGGCALVVGNSPLSIVTWNLKNLTVESDSMGALPFWEPSFDAEARNRFRVNRLLPTEAIGPLLTASAGISVGRDSLSSDTAFLFDGLEAKAVTFLGGSNSAGPTMGRKNFLPIEFDTVVTDTIQQPSTWMLMLYIAGDYGDSLRSPDRWYFDALNQIEDTLTTAPRNVNVAVLYDTRRGRAGGGAISQSTGATFRGTFRKDASDAVRNLKLITPSVNTGDSLTLSAFIKWVKDSLPSADHYVLALKGDGAGWQGLCGDEGDDDRLNLGELESALRVGLEGDTLDLLILDAPLMGQLEVANQLEGFAHFMVASPEMTGPADFDYARFVGKLVSEPAISPLNLAKFSVESILSDRLAVSDPSAVWAATQLDSITSLRNLVNLLAQNLRDGVADPCGLGYSDDNFQIKLRERLLGTEHYGRQAKGMADFIDLRHFAKRLNGFNPAGCQTGHTTGASGIDNLLNTSGSVIVSIFRNSAVRPNAWGLSVYFPSSRQHWPPIPAALKNPVLSYSDSSDHPFDATGLVLEGGVFDARYVYAADLEACYPHDLSGCSALPGNDSAKNYPYPPLPNFAFTDDTQWDEFLIRYYKPVADVESTFLLKNINLSFSLKGKGTSDPDSDSLTYIWDLDSLSDSPWPCDSIYREDVDKNCRDDSTDDGDIWGGQNVNFVGGFSTAGDHILWLTVWDDYHLLSSNRRFQASRSKDSVVVQIEFKGVKVAYEESPVDTFYFNTLNSLDPRPGNDPVDLRQLGARTGVASNRFTDDYQSEPHILWSTGSVSTNTFPPACQTALNNAMANDSQSAWICAPLVGLDTTAKPYFKTKWGFDIDTTRDSASYVIPYAGLNHFLSDLDTLPLTPTILQKLSNLGCPSFPLLVTDRGDTVAAARVIADSQRVIIYSTFGLEHIADPIRRQGLLIRVLSYLITPGKPEGLPECPQACLKGDVNQNDTLSPPDAVLGLNLIFLGTGGGDSCAADVNCVGGLTPADAGILLRMIFLGEPDACALFKSDAIELVEPKSEPDYRSKEIEEDLRIKEYKQ